jgi:pyruvyltransferase
MTGLPVKSVPIRPGHGRGVLRFRPDAFSYLAIGSIISRANAKSIVWGAGAFGTETKDSFNVQATYQAVRGPLTRNLLRIYGIQCPAIYGDPALLLPLVFNPEVEKRFKVGIILRWAEKDWNEVQVSDDVKKIYLGTDNVEDTLQDILSCERIISSSLHGIILADAYGIPSAWLSSTTPKGLEFKFYDYFLSVNKLQKPQGFDFSVSKLTWEHINRHFQFNGATIEFDKRKLLKASPFIDLDSIN